MFKKARLFTPFILFTILTLTLTYNNCSTQSFYATKFSKVPDEFLHGFRVEINNGNYSTKTLQNVPLTFEVPNRHSEGKITEYEMKISRTSDCSDGEWKPYQRKTSWTFQSNGEEERLLFIYMKFREKTPTINYSTKNLEEIQRESHCIHKSIVYDKLSPRNLTLDNKPAGETSQKSAEFRFTAEDYSPIQFECQLKKPDNSLIRWAPCVSGKTYGSSDLEEDGEYTFYLKAEDLAGNETKASENEEHTWIIDSTAPSITIGEKQSDGTFVEKCPDDSSEEEEVGSVLVKALNLDPPTKLYCKPNPDTVLCGTITDPSKNPLEINASDGSTHHFIKKEIVTDYFKKTLFVQAEDSVGLLSNPKKCTWYRDTGDPTIEWTDTGKPEYSFGKSINAIDPKSFEIEINDNSLLLPNSSNSDIKIKYKVHISETTALVGGTCDNPDSEDWCDLSSSSTSSPYPNRITSNDKTYLKQRIYIKGLDPGIETPKRHTIDVKVEDAVGNPSSTLQHQWDVYGEIEKRVSTQSISSTSRNKVDILFVIDDSSPAMGRTSNVLGESIPHFTSNLDSENLNWQIAVTSMEQYGNGIKNFGKLVPLINDEPDDQNNYSFLTYLSRDFKKYILSSQTSCSGPFYCHGSRNKLNNIFKRTITEIDIDDTTNNENTVNNFTFSGGEEFGIQSINVLLDHYNRDSVHIENYTLPTPAERQAIRSFFREDSTFVVILITDEKNCSCEVVPATCNHEQINRPNFLVEEVESVLGEDKKFIFYPIIPKPGEGYKHSNYQYCRNGYPANDDDDYWTLAEITQSRSGVLWVDVNHNEDTRTHQSIEGCESNYDPVGYRKELCMITKDISRTTTSTIQLDCKPTSNHPESEDYKPKYFYSSHLNAPADDSSFTAIERNRNTLTIETDDDNSVEVDIRESWTNNSSPQATNRVILTAKRGQDIPAGTYKVEYFCHPDDGS